MIAVHPFIDIAADLRPGVQHQVLADQAAGIGQPVGKPRRCRIEQQARRADAVAGHDDHLGRLKSLHPVGVVVDRAGGHAVFVGGDLAHPAARAQFDTGADGMRPVGDVGARLRALGAAGRAMTEIDARRPPVILGRRDRGVRRPPVPAQLVHRLGVTGAGLAQRQRRHRRLPRRIGRIAGQAGNAHHAVVFGKERLQRRIIDRPVVGDAIERAHPEIRRMHAREMRRVHDGAAADAVEVGHLHRRVVVVDRIIGRPRPPVRADVEIGVSPRLPVPPVAWEVGLLHPIALFQAEDFHPRLGQAPGHRGARCAGADDQHVHHFVHAAPPCELSWRDDACETAAGQCWRLGAAGDGHLAAYDARLGPTRVAPPSTPRIWPVM